MISSVAFAFLIVFLCLLLKQRDNGIPFLLLLAGTVLLFSMAFREIKLLYEQLQSLFAKSETMQIYLKQLLKILGVTYLADFGSSICKDAGYLSLGKQVEVIGKVSMLVMMIPLLLTVIDTVFQLF